MIIDKEETEKYLDFLITKIVDVTKFSIKDILITNQYLSSEHNNFAKIGTAVLNLGITYDYFENLGEGFFKLTKRGLDAKEAGGHFKYQKSLKRQSMTRYEFINVILTIFILCTTIFTIYQNHEKSLLEKQFENLNKTNKVLQNEYIRQKELNKVLHLKFEMLMDSVKSTIKKQ